VVVCLLATNCGSNCSVMQAIDGCKCAAVSCQSAVTCLGLSRTIKIFFQNPLGTRQLRNIQLLTPHREVTKCHTSAARCLFWTASKVINYSWFSFFSMSSYNFQDFQSVENKGKIEDFQEGIKILCVINSSVFTRWQQHSFTAEIWDLQASTVQHKLCHATA